MKRQGWIILGILVLLVVILVLYRYYQGLGTIAPMAEPEAPVVIAIFGVDKKYDLSGEFVEDAMTADSTVLAFLKESPKNVTFLVFPGNAIVEDSEWEGRTIGEVFALGGAEGLVDLLGRVVGNPVSKYVSIDYQGFMELVDLMGGISIAVDRPIAFVDRLGGIETSLDAGTQHLDGEQVLAYARFVDEATGEAERLERHKKIIMEIARQLISKLDLSKVDDVYSIFKANVSTDFTLDDILRLSTYAKDLAEGDISTVLVPGSFEEEFWIVDKAGLDRILQEVYELRD